MRCLIHMAKQIAALHDSFLRSADASRDLGGRRIDMAADISFDRMNLHWHDKRLSLEKKNTATTTEAFGRKAYRYCELHGFTA